VQPDDAAVPASGRSVPAEQKTENFFFTSFELHLGQLISWFPKTSFSNSSPQLLHLYSKIGIFSSPLHPLPSREGDIQSASS
jgi:hypothetical protein